MTNALQLTQGRKTGSDSLCNVWPHRHIVINVDDENEQKKASLKRSNGPPAQLYSEHNADPYVVDAVEIMFDAQWRF